MSTLTATERSHRRENLNANWAFQGKKPRPEQEKAFDFIAESDSPIVLIEAPTGVGKSGICMTLARSETGAIMTPQKILQDQYVADWPDVPLVKGRGNYSCDSSRAQTKGRIQDCDKGRSMCNAGAGCPYKTAADRFFNSPVGITNYSYFFSTMNWDKSVPGEWLLFDEAHEMESQLIESAAVEIDGELCNELGISFETPTDTEEVLLFCDKVLRALSSKIDDIDSRIKGSDGSLQLLDDSAISQGLKGVSMRELAMKSKMEQAINRIQFLLSDMDKGNEWVYHVAEEVFKAKPLLAYGLYQELIRPLNKKVLLTSATMVPPDLMARWFGWQRGQYESLQLDSPFPVDNRQVVYHPVASLSRRNMDEKLPEVVAFIERIVRAKAYRHVKGVIHCHSFRLGEQILNLLSSETRERVTAHRFSDNREQVLKQHIMTPHPSILLSPSMTEGVDLRDDLARFVIFPKMPYPSLGDPWVRRRLEVDEGWYNHQVAKTIVQGCGRAVRHTEDRADSYILDGNFERLFSGFPEYFPKWFRKSVVFK